MTDRSDNMPITKKRARVVENDTTTETAASDSKKATTIRSNDDGGDKNNCYQGYVFPSSSSSDRIQLEEVDAPTCDAATFFARFVKQRRPCILNNILGHENVDKNNHQHDSSFEMSNITPQLLVDVAGSETVQVERRPSATAMFGQNRTPQHQILLTVQELVQRLQNKPQHVVVGENDDDDDNNKEQDQPPLSGLHYYLSTQDEEEDDDAENGSNANMVQDDASGDGTTKQREPCSRPRAIFGTPCRQLLAARHIPATLPWAGHLELQSCNLWMGGATPSDQPSCSGLHHDFHDNFYILFKGHKEFRLYAPTQVQAMHVFGQVERVYPTGLISYRHNPLRSDAVPLVSLNMNSDDDDDNDDEEEEVVLGKGFDYKDDDDDDDSDGNNGFAGFDGPDDYDELVAREEEEEENNNNDTSEKDDKATTTKSSSQQEQLERPASFSCIDPTLPAATLQQEYPDFFKCPECIVTLQPGQALYLPASWFHCVSSSSGSLSSSANDADEKKTKSSVHLALNYWYYPPDQCDNFEQPYKHK